MPLSYLRGIFERCLAESNRCSRFCRPVPNRSAKAPFPYWDCKYSDFYRICKIIFTFFTFDDYSLDTGICRDRFELMERCCPGMCPKVRFWGPLGTLKLHNLLQTNQLHIKHVLKGRKKRTFKHTITSIRLTLAYDLLHIEQETLEVLPFRVVDVH